MNDNSPVPKPKTITNTVVGWVGAIVTLITAIVTEGTVKEITEEIPSKWATSESRGIAAGAKEGVLKLVDPKQWKSSLAYVGTIAFGWAATTWLVNKIYNKPAIIKMETVHLSESSQENLPVKAKSWVAVEHERSESNNEISR